MKKLLLTLLLASSNAFAGPLEAFQEDFKNGTALSHQEDYKDLYGRSTGRSIEFLISEDHGDRVDARYKTSMIYDDVPYEQYGIASFQIEEEKVVAVEFVPITEKAIIDMAVAGQGADVLTTAAAIQSGFAEGNPVVAGAVASPAGTAALVGLKLGAAKILDNTSVKQCVEGRTAIGTIGWIAAAWNIGVVAAGPLAGLAAGMATGLGVWKYVAEDAPLRCVE